MSALLDQVKEANEKNRRNVHLAMEEFNVKLAQEANGYPMSVTRYQDRYIALENGEAEIVENAS